MFSTLIASEPRGGTALSPATWGFSTAGHFLLVIAVAAIVGGGDADEKTVQGDVTYVDIAEIEETSRETTPAEAPPPPPADLPPEPEPVEVPTNQLAGFQELTVPPEVSGIPEPASIAAVRAEDFGGRGVLGGIAGGIALRPTRPVGAQTGTSEGSTSLTELPPLPADVVDVRASILNLSELIPQMAKMYPPSYRDAGIEAEVLVQFAVGVDGRVESEGLQVLRSPYPEFEGPTRALLLLLRWRPARQNGRAVRSWVRMPVTWKTIDR